MGPGSCLPKVEVPTRPLGMDTFPFPLDTFGHSRDVTTTKAVGAERGLDSLLPSGISPLFPLESPPCCIPYAEWGVLAQWLKVCSSAWEEPGKPVLFSLELRRRLQAAHSCRRDNLG